MATLFKNVKDVENGIKALQDAIKECKGDVILRSCDGTETFNMKSTISQYIAIGQLLKDHGDTYEFFCMDKNDEVNLINFFHTIVKE